MPKMQRGLLIPIKWPRDSPDTHCYVDISSVTKMYIGVGDRESPQPSGMGWIYIDDIAVTKRTP
jgi:hypothetical protein